MLPLHAPPSHVTANGTQHRPSMPPVTFPTMMSSIHMPPTLSSHTSRSCCRHTWQVWHMRTEPTTHPFQVLQQANPTEHQSSNADVACLVPMGGARHAQPPPIFTAQTQHGGVVRNHTRRAVQHLWLHTHTRHDTTHTPGLRWFNKRKPNYKPTSKCSCGMLGVSFCAHGWGQPCPAPPTMSCMHSIMLLTKQRTCFQPNYCSK